MPTTTSTTLAAEAVGRSRPRARLLARRRIVEPVAVVLASALLAVQLTWPLAAHLHHHVVGDQRNAAATVEWLDGMTGGEGAERLAVTEADRPGPPLSVLDRTAAERRSTLLWGPGRLVAEAIGATATYNLVILLGLALSAAAMYWLVRVLGAGMGPAAWAGLAFAALPWHVLKVDGQPALTHLEGLPLLVGAAVLWFRRPDLARAGLLALAAALLWLTSVALGIVGLVAALVLLAAGALGLRTRLGGRTAATAGAAAALPHVVLAAVFAALMPLAAAAPVLYLSRYGARPWEFLVPPASNPLFGDETGAWLEANSHDAAVSETALYVGWVTIVLAGAWLIGSLLRATVSLERRFLAVGLSACAGAGLVLSLPSPFPGTSVAMPVRAMWELEPAFAIPSRFVLLVAVALVPAAALALEGVRAAALGAFRSPRAGALVGTALCLTFAGLTYLELAPDPGAVVPYVGR